MTSSTSSHPRCASGLTLPEARELIDALHCAVALLDRDGCILSVNQAWEALGAEADAELGCCEVGADYRLVCEKAARRADTDAGLLAQGLSSVLSGGRPFFEMQAPCAVGDELHVFRARVTRLADARGTYFLVSREDVSGVGLGD